LSSDSRQKPEITQPGAELCAVALVVTVNNFVKFKGTNKYASPMNNWKFGNGADDEPV
jgi:hypothetical protein